VVSLLNMLAQGREVGTFPAVFASRNSSGPPPGPAR
jgi:hypothetical protein